MINLFVFSEMFQEEKGSKEPSSHKDDIIFLIKSSKFKMQAVNFMHSIKKNSHVFCFVPRLNIHWKKA